MALIAGDSGCTTGLSKRIYDARIVGPPAWLAEDHTALKSDCYAIAVAVVAEIVANAVVTVSPGIVTTCGTGPGSTTSPGTGTIA